ncbi:hypothetical protein [Variovorax sp. PAMC 28711]|uniref:hypothetical protein n=1 Tax=Variovorax sp. PAMC 28711 TaxID=1795631 RepID=UPI0012E84080|nr:hypothetical protein [Variovorax sp. PAMC 28711]
MCYFADQTADEFAFVLEKMLLVSPNELGRQFVDAWCHSVFNDAAVDPLRLARFEEALRRDCSDAVIHSLPLQLHLLAAKHRALGRASAQDRVTELEAELNTAQVCGAEATARATALEHSIS